MTEILDFVQQTHNFIALGKTAAGEMGRDCRLSLLLADGR